jgi:ubiquinone/menaquinone biosynthesis C-methylase UbiE
MSRLSSSRIASGNRAESIAFAGGALIPRIAVRDEIGHRTDLLSALKGQPTALLCLPRPHSPTCQQAARRFAALKLTIPRLNRALLLPETTRGADAVELAELGLKTYVALTPNTIQTGEKTLIYALSDTTGCILEAGRLPPAQIAQLGARIRSVFPDNGLDASRLPASAAGTWAWDQYWCDGRLASCGGTGGTNYQPTITTAWRRFFGRLADGARILDVCTGNGAIARLAAEVAAARRIHFVIDAFDSAAIAPDVMPAGIGRDMISFRERIAAESTPYPAGCFDCLVGQYAIEYTELDRSLPEMVRVSKSDCRVRFMIHAKEGDVVAAARRQLGDIERLRRTGDIFAVARKLVELRAEATPERDLRAMEARYRQGMQALQQAASDAVEPAMYHDTCSVLTHALLQQSRVGAEPVLDKIAEVAGSLEAHAARLAAMNRAAFDGTQAQRMADRAETLWKQPFRYQPVVRADNVILGWTVESVSAGVPGGTTHKADME